MGCTLRTAMAFGKVVALLFAVCVAVALAAPQEGEDKGAAPTEAQTKGFGAPFLGGYHGYAAPYAYGAYAGAYGHPGFYGHGFHGAYWDYDNLFSVNLSINTHEGRNTPC